VVCQLQEDIVRKLLDFEFTVNQAKVYLSVVQSGLTCVSRIAKATHLHRQDIYKILPKLEKMGLIAKTIDKPLTIEAIPIKAALNSLVSTERKKAKERISRLEANIEELAKAIGGQRERETTREQEEGQLVLLTTDAGIKSMADLSFENAMIECDFVASRELLTLLMHRYREHFQKLSRRGVRIRVIVENLNNEEAEKAVEKIRPDMGDFEAKFIHKSTPLPYRIIDNKELWIRRKRVTESGVPSALWTDGRNMVQFYKENFEEAWNDPLAIHIYPKKRLAKKELAEAQ
jgi:sugar-specific transcriptional regulator TrmB